MENEKITIEQLDKLQSDAFQKLKDWVKHLEELNDYKLAVLSDTVPPGQPPPNPPGH